MNSPLWPNPETGKKKGKKHPNLDEWNLAAQSRMETRGPLDTTAGMVTIWVRPDLFCCFAGRESIEGLSRLRSLLRSLIGRLFRYHFQDTTSEPQTWGT